MDRTVNIIGGPTFAQLRAPPARRGGLGSTFASHYTGRVSLAEALSLKAIGVYGKQATGEKYLITPND